MIKTVGVRKLKNEATQIMRDVREMGAEYVITVSGEPVAKIVPVERKETAEAREERIREHLREVDRLAKLVSAAWKSPLSAAEAVAEQRREL